MFEPNVLRCEVDVVYMFEKTHRVAPKPHFDGKKPSTVRARHVSGVAVSSPGSPAPLEPPLWMPHFIFHCRLCSALQIFLTVPAVISGVLIPLFIRCSAAVPPPPAIYIFLTVSSSPSLPPALPPPSSACSFLPLPFLPSVFFPRRMPDPCGAPLKGLL